jgi:S-adenosylmethionine:tRNA ribosyltransferase-isomerase
LKVAEFDFELPAELIAQHPAPRGQSRLLTLDRRSSRLSHGSIGDLPAMLRSGDLLVNNNSRVFPARLLGRRIPSGGAVECLLVRREEADVGPGRGEIWSVLVHPGQKLKPGAMMRFEGSGGTLIAEVLERQFFGRRRIRLWADSGGTVDAIVDAIGHVPLPPYIHRDDTQADRERYQTVFAERRGSIAAPTAGLHFDRPLLQALDAAGVERASITLHVGYGTFKPVRADDVEAHVVDAEPYEISEMAASQINAALDTGRRIVAVGTTTTRALEDAAMRGGGRPIAGSADANLFIYPGHQFRVVSSLLTNFHLPKSSLLMLTAAFGGRERVLEAYRAAIAERYRFYSYGDAMLIL